MVIKRKTALDSFEDLLDYASTGAPKVTKWGDEGEEEGEGAGTKETLGAETRVKVVPQQLIKAWRFRKARAKPKVVEEISKQARTMHSFSTNNLSKAKDRFKQVCDIST